jgi:uncharacterized protein with HEPN domain
MSVPRWSATRSMLSDRARKALLDIRDNILRFYAATRCLEIISEATRRLPSEIHHRHPHIAWRNIRDAGNIYRHDYDGVQERLVLETVRSSLPQLLRVIDEEIG